MGVIPTNAFNISKDEYMLMRRKKLWSRQLKFTLMALLALGASSFAWGFLTSTTLVLLFSSLSLWAFRNNFAELGYTLNKHQKLSQDGFSLQTKLASLYPIVGTFSMVVLLQAIHILTEAEALQAIAGLEAEAGILIFISAIIPFIVLLVLAIWSFVQIALFYIISGRRYGYGWALAIQFIALAVGLVAIWHFL